MTRCLLTAAFALMLLPGVVAAQDGPQNLEFYPTNMTRGEIIAEMRHFSFALGVRCEFCHVEREDGQGFDFASDAIPNKEKARVMLFMTDDINRRFLPELGEGDGPRVEVTCKTCHRGTQKPRLLWQEMVLTTHEEGVVAAIEQFERLRANYDNAGAYDFREWETNVAAEELAKEGRHEEAIAIWMMNAQRFPESDAILSGMGESYEALGDTTGAIQAYEAALELNPNRNDVRRSLVALTGGE